jgi:hypothetical protein
MSKSALITLPASTQITIFLIREELKSRKHFNTLHQLGLTECHYQPHLDSLILETLGIDASSDETFEVYDSIIEKRSNKIEPTNDSVMKQAMKAYHELLSEKKNLKKQSA